MMGAGFCFDGGGHHVPGKRPGEGGRNNISRRIAMQLAMRRAHMSFERIGLASDGCAIASA